MVESSAPTGLFGPKEAAPEKKLQEILPKAGLVYSEKATLSEVLCKPKLLPLKSATLLKLEALESNLAQAQIAGEGVTKAGGNFAGGAGSGVPQ